MSTKHSGGESQKSDEISGREPELSHGSRVTGVEPELSGLRARAEVIGEALILYVMNHQGDRQPLMPLPLYSVYRVGVRQNAFTCSAETALEAARWLRPDLIVSEMILPEMDGIELLRQFKMRPELSEVPVIMLTPAGDLTGLAAARQSGASDVVPASEYDNSMLGDSVAAVLARSQYRPASRDELLVLRGSAQAEGRYIPLVQFVGAYFPPRRFYEQGYLGAYSFLDDDAPRLAQRVMPDGVFVGFVELNLQTLHLLDLLRTDPGLGDVPVVMPGFPPLFAGSPLDPTVREALRVAGYGLELP